MIWRYPYFRKPPHVSTNPRNPDMVPWCQYAMNIRNTSIVLGKIMVHLTRFRQRSFIAASDDIWVRFQPATRTIRFGSPEVPTPSQVAWIYITGIYIIIILQNDVNCTSCVLFDRKKHWQRATLNVYQFTRTSKQKVFHPHQDLSLCISLHRFDRLSNLTISHLPETLPSQGESFALQIPRMLCRAAPRAWRPKASKPPHRQCKAASTGQVEDPKMIKSMFKWGFPINWGTQNGWFMVDNFTKMGVPLFWETSKSPLPQNRPFCTQC